MARKKITQVTAEDIESIIGNSVQSAKNRLVGNAAEQKKMFVRPIANTDGSPSVAKLVQRLAQETEESLQGLENSVEDLEDSLVTPPPADSIPLSGVFFEYDRETETLNIVGEKGVSEEDVASIIEDETGGKFTELETDMETLSANKQDALVFADAYNADTNKVATEATVARETAKIIGGAGESFDTLKEIADWITAHPNSVAAINAMISANTERINTNARNIALNTSKADKNTSDIATQTQRINNVQSSVNTLSTSKQDKLSFAGTYNATTNRVATEQTVADEIAKIVGGADAGFDTLKEIADWILNNPDSVATINAMVRENAEAIQRNADAVSENAEAITKNTEAIKQLDVKSTLNANAINDNTRRIGLAEADIVNLRDRKQNSLEFADAYNADTNKVATENTVKREVAAIVAEAPDEFNTLKEIAAWIAEHPDDIGAINALIQENKQAIRLNAELITNNTKALNAQSTKINANEVGINDLKVLQERLSASMDKKVEKTTTANQLYGTDENGDPAFYPTDSVGTQVLVDGQKVKEFNADEKFGKTGGVIDGNVTIAGSLTVKGITTTNDTETLLVKDNVIIANSDGATLAEESGFAIKTGETGAYGIMYDPVDDGVKIGLGGFDADGNFVYNEGQAQFLATRADNIADGNLPQWDNEKKQFIDSGTKISECVKRTEYAGDKVFGLAQYARLDYNENGSQISVPGIVSYSSVFGILAFNNTTWKNTLAISGATNSIIDKQEDLYRPIIPYRLSHAVKVGVTANKETLTDEEKTSACDWLGATKLYLHTITETSNATSDILYIVATFNTPIPSGTSLLQILRGEPHTIISVADKSGKLIKIVPTIGYPPIKGIYFNEDSSAVEVGSVISGVYNDEVTEL